MKNNTLQPVELANSAPKHPVWCTHAECEDFGPWSTAMHRARPSFLSLEPNAGDWESNRAMIRGTLQRIECEDGFTSSVIDLTVMSESGGLELDPERMRKLADWLNATADYFEGVAAK